MKKALALTLCILTVFALFMCSCQKEPERVIVSSGGAFFSYSVNPDDIDHVISTTKAIVYGTIKQVRDGVYKDFEDYPYPVPYYVNSIKIEKVILGEYKKGDIIDFSWGSGYLSYPLYLEKENISEKMLTGELYEQNKDNPNAFMEIVNGRFCLMEKGEKYLLFLDNDAFGVGAYNYARFENGKTKGCTMFEDGLTYDQVIDRVNAAMERAKLN